MAKLALVILLCCVSVAFQQQYQSPARFFVRPPLQYYSSSARPLFFPSYGYSDQYLQLLANYYSDPSQDDAYSLLSSLTTDSDLVDAEGRAPVRPQAKFFGAAKLLSSLLSSLNLNSVLTTFTSTSLATITSTATSVSIKSCISSGQFIAGSTNVCSRKRRGIPIEQIEALAAIDASPVEPLEASAVAVFRSSSIDARSQDQPELASSIEQSISDDQPPMNRPKRAVIITVTSTITSFSLTTTSVVKSYTLVGAASLSCLPSGYTVC